MTSMNDVILFSVGTDTMKHYERSRSGVYVVGYVHGHSVHDSRKRTFCAQDTGYKRMKGIQAIKKGHSIYFRVTVTAGEKDHLLVVHHKYLMIGVVRRCPATARMKA